MVIEWWLNGILRDLPSGNQTWQWKILCKWMFLARKITDPWSIVQHAMFDYQRVTISFKDKSTCESWMKWMKEISDEYD